MLLREIACPPLQTWALASVSSQRLENLSFVCFDGVDRERVDVLRLAQAAIEPSECNAGVYLYVCIYRERFDTSGLLLEQFACVASLYWSW